jgi:hypothetical protein
MTYNVAYVAGKPTRKLLNTLKTKGTVLYHLTGLGIIGLETNVSENELLAVLGVTHVDEDRSVDIESHVDAWHLLRLSKNQLPMPTVPSQTYDGEFVTVYLMDSKIVRTPELVDANIRVLHEDVDTTDTFHGTAMASVIVGKNLGVSPKVNLVSVQIPLGTSVPVSKILFAFDTILRDTERPAVSVLNCSWSVPKSQLMDSKINELQEAGIVVVAAAGNSGIAADLVSPAGLDSVIGVGASDAYDRVISWESGMSNWGPEVDVFAPGIDVTVENTQGLLESSGTSVSAAIVSGVVAQYIAKFSSHSAAQIQQNLVSDAVPNILFWDDSLYGTTPNRLIQSVKLQEIDIWGIERPTEGYHAVKAGEFITINASMRNPIVAVQYTQIGTGKPIMPYDWVTVSNIANNSATINVAPPTDLISGKYICLIQGINTEGEVVSILWLKIGVYSEHESELSDITDEKYLVYYSETDEIRITAHLDCCPGNGGPTCTKVEVCASPTGDFGSFTCQAVSLGPYFATC